MAKFIDISGKQFGKLKVVSRADNKICGHKPITMWNCVCECGKNVIVSGNSLRKGHTKSCGCITRKHGFSRKERLYETWKNMKRRCNDPANKRWNQYGGRGITVCEEWNNDYVSFRNWALLNGYSDDLTIDRIDVNKGYFPENCRWATLSEQMNNTTRNRYITFNGKTQTLSQWANELAMSYSTVNHRIQRGWSMERIVSQPQREVRTRK